MKDNLFKKFKKIGEYRLNNESKKIERKITNKKIKISERLCLVYAFFIDDNCKYIGKTIQGYKRPLGYHKNIYMPTVYNNLKKNAEINKVIEIYCRVFEKKEIEFEELLINPFSAYEEALINKLGVHKLWNNQKY